MHARLVALSLLCAASLARADPTPGVDLRAPAIDPDAAARARTGKLVGIALLALGGLATSFGVASVTASGVAALSGKTLLPDNVTLGLDVGALSLGALGMGLGASTWALTDGAARLGRPAAAGRALRIGGATLMATGAVLTTLSWAWAAAAMSCGHDDCFDVATPIAFSALPAGLAALALGAPLYVLGARRGKAALRIDSIGPISFAGGGGVGIGGRF